VRLALVTPWYGRELIGGAERLVWDLAHALARNGAQVEVLSTCARSFLHDWSANYHRSGTSVDAGGVTLRRFSVDARDRVAFNRANTALMSVPRVALHGDRTVLDPGPAQDFVRENLGSRALLAYLEAHGANYDAVLFAPYLYGPTLQGLPLVAERAFLIPCLHDEAYAYLEPVRAAFAAARGVLFNSAGEEETAGAIYGPGVLSKSCVIGHAVDAIAPPPAPVAIGAFAPHRSRYVLYLGRQDRSKNVDFLLDAFRTFREGRVATSLQLVLAGPHGAAHGGDGVLDLGVVSEPAKAALLTYARALAQPSLHESFSRAVYESWSARRPVLVHGDCRATARAVEDSGGGWVGTTRDEWTKMFAALDESADADVDAFGARGWAVAMENGTWDDVARRTLEAIRARSAPASVPRAGAAPVVSPALWDGVQPAHHRWSGSRNVLLSIGPLDAGNARRLLETFVAFLARTRDARLVIFDADCDAEARRALLRERAELDLHDEVELAGATPAERYAAYRAAGVGLVLGGPLALDAVVQPLWFDVPLVALAAPALPEPLEACAIVIDAFDARRLAALLRIVANDAQLRSALVAEGRRVRARHVPRLQPSLATP
jgi:glycosyltransferase involved in cell wall biosynthesis